MRKRTLGFNAAFEKVTTAIEKAESFPTALLNIVGVETVPDWDAEPTARSSTFRSLGPAKEILFGKPSNPEQTRIAKRLEQHGAVIVQGPPGTGKSHTIGNLIGHLLAQGQSILVTSHTTKALRDLRDHVVEELRPLCVSVLDNDLDRRQQLKESVEVISERLSNSDQEQLEQEAAQLQNERLELIERLEELQDDLLNARNNEYRDIVLAGESTSPSEAARIVAAGKDTHDWIPGPLTPNVPLPLSQAEVLELYLSNDKTTELDDLHVDDPLPEIEKLVSPTQFREMIENGDGLSQQAAQFNKESWRDSKFTVKSIQAIESLREGFDNALNLLKEMPPWQITVVNAGRIGKMESSSWELLIERIDNAVERVSANKVDILRFYPDIDKATTITEQLTHATTIRTRLEGGRRLGWLTLLLNREWRETIRNWKVLDMPPSSLEHFQAIERTLLAGQAKQELSQIWDSLIVPYGVETSSELGLNFVEVCQQFRPQISDSLTWWENKWQPLVDTLVDLGFDWEGFIRQLPPRTEANGTMMRIIDGVEQLLLDQLTATMCFLKSRINKQREKVLFEETESYIRTEVLSMREAISQRNATDYENSYNHLTQAVSRRKHAERRKELLERLQPFAECWVQQIRSRNGIHGETNTPGNPVAAWQWRQLEDELNRRSEINIDELITSIERTKDQIASVTIQLIDRRAWAKQVERTNLRQRQSLIGWLDTVRRMGKGHGKRVELLKREAQRKMVDCQSAVPAWIMPISRLVESFDFETTKFDVVIIDEASQCDVTGLLAITLGKRVVVVGDHEQVSPSAVGQTVSEVDKLIASCLKDIPNSDLYDGKMSIYDVARQSFGGSICLQEHFRCVPDIINFSNYLAYQGQIKPLRDETSSPIHPAVISYRVEGASRQSKSKINQEEAEAIASLIVAAIEHPMYADQTFGVINLLGSEQATEIEKLLLRYLTPEQYEDRRIVCGNSAQFQGDERDVIFLSMVDSPTDGPLPLKQRPDDQKRYNVAASRARNQMWVVHSLNSDIDLKPGDLRRRLIEHALDPKSVAREVGEAIARAESPFEEMVIQHLIEARYKVTPQWRVGAYRIDIVVEGEGGRRLAVECDGDRYHPPEKLPEDMARQAILERLGWTFHRLRGSEFFRTPDTTMERLFDKLKRMGIEPLSGLGEAGPAEVEQSRETVEAVIRRGAELRELWRQQDEADLNPENNFSEPENITTSVALPRDIAIASNDNDQEVDLDREGIEVDQ
ncbi:MAG: AAA domain-containing protein [Planctomycetaceae bacterium]